jgi:hypothetical protein
LTHVFSATFGGKKINASQHPYRMLAGIDGLFPGTLFCGSFATSAALFESLYHNQNRQPALRLTDFFV